MKLSFLTRAACASIMLLCSVAASRGTAGAVQVNGKNYQVAIQNFAFEPKTITVPVGARVVWINRDEEPHVVTSAGSLFVSSKALDTSDSYAVTFSKPGTYAYYCSIHPMMVGTIIVQ
jgi:plastocyanin